MTQLLSPYCHRLAIDVQVKRFATLIRHIALTPSLAGTSPMVAWRHCKSAINHFCSTPRGVRSVHIYVPAFPCHYRIRKMNEFCWPSIVPRVFNNVGCCCSPVVLLLGREYSSMAEFMLYMNNIPGSISNKYKLYPTPAVP